MKEASGSRGGSGSGREGKSHRRKGADVGAGGKGKGGESSAAAWKGLEEGRVVVVVGRKGSGRLVSVEVLLQAIAT